MRPLRRGRDVPAPRFWPTSVAAALLTPNDGSSANRTMRMPMVLPATAALPKPDRMRMMPIQDAVFTKFWNVAVPEMRRIDRIVSPSIRQCARVHLQPPAGPCQVVQLIQHAAAAADGRGRWPRP